MKRTECRAANRKHEIKNGMISSKYPDKKQEEGTES